MHPQEIENLKTQLKEYQKDKQMHGGNYVVDKLTGKNVTEAIKQIEETLKTKEGEGEKKKQDATIKLRNEEILKERYKY